MHMYACSRLLEKVEDIEDKFTVWASKESADD